MAIRQPSRRKMSMDGVLWQLKMTVGVRTQKSRITRILQEEDNYIG